MYSFICALGVFLMMAAIVLASSIRIIPEHERVVVLRMGRFIGVRGPGLYLAIPLLDMLIRVDLRPTERKVENVAFTSYDNQRMSVDWMWNYKITDPEQVVMNTPNFEKQMQEAAIYAIQQMYAGDLLTSRAEAEVRMKDRLDTVAANLGLRVNEVRVTEIRKV